VLAPAALSYLATKGFDPVFGGRPVKRVIQREIETPLARALLGNEFRVRCRHALLWCVATASMFLQRPM
jgi:ATP-dependent Clp protease ATP-binding subunit ClpB